MQRILLTLDIQTLIKSLIIKPKREPQKYKKRTNLAILNEFIGDDVFTECDWSEEDYAPVFNISILNNYKNTELTDDNNSKVVGKKRLLCKKSITKLSKIVLKKIRIIWSINNRMHLCLSDANQPTTSTEL